ncbi:MAG: hypothetical protein KDA22_02015 [Phycisphaerales bacterium]|nr:hypothetical protein [Phycisphaerales bacterium]
MTRSSPWILLSTLVLACPAGVVAQSAADAEDGASPAAATDASAANTEPAAKPEPAPGVEERESLLRRLVPTPMTRSELDAWATALELTDGDTTRLNDLYAAYRLAYASAMDQHGGRVASLLNASYQYDADRHAMVPRFTPQLLELLDERRHGRVAVLDAERELASVVGAMASAELQPVARRLAFQRFFAVAGEPTVFASAGTDLVQLVEELDLTPEERAALASTLDDYIRKMTPVLEWRSRTLIELEREKAQILVILGPEWDLTATPEEREQVREQLDAIQQAVLRTELPLRGVNRETLTALARLLRPDRASLLRDRYHRAVAPQLFEDERTLSDLVKLSSQMPGVGTEDAESRLEMLMAAQARLLPLGIDQADAADEASTIDRLDRQAATHRISLLIRKLELGVTRREILAETARGLQALLGAEEAPLVPQLNAYIADLANRDRADRWTIDVYRVRLEELLRPPPPPPAPEAPVEQEFDPR